MTTTTIKVTAVHIARGTRGRGGVNPIALAADELFPGAPVDVFGNWMHACGAPDGCKDADLPGEAEDFVHAWIDGKPVKPFEFTVRWEDARRDDDEGADDEGEVPF